MPIRAGPELVHAFPPSVTIYGRVAAHDVEGLLALKIRPQTAARKHSFQRPVCHATGRSNLPPSYENFSPVSSFRGPSRLPECRSACCCTRRPSIVSPSSGTLAAGPPPASWAASPPPPSQRAPGCSTFRCSLRATANATKNGQKEEACLHLYRVWGSCIDVQFNLYSSLFNVHNETVFEK